jgi:hypothetical protein
MNRRDFLRELLLGARDALALLALSTVAMWLGVRTRKPPADSRPLVQALPSTAAATAVAAWSAGVVSKVDPIRRTITVEWDRVPPLMDGDTIVFARRP